MTDLSFSRALLKESVAAVLAAAPATEVNKSSITRSGFRDGFCFSYGKFHTSFKASDAYHARAKGWNAYLASLGSTTEASATK